MRRSSPSSTASRCARATRICSRRSTRAWPTSGPTVRTTGSTPAISAKHPRRRKRSSSSRRRVDLRWEILIGYWPLFLQGLEMTITLTLVALVAGMGLGLVFGIIRSARGVLAPPGRRARVLLLPAQWIGSAYVGVFRGTPLLVQILLVHFALMPTLVHPDHGLLLSGEAAAQFRQEHGAFFSGSLTLALNAGAYIAEIFRAGIVSIGTGQVEAAHALGLHYVQTLRLVLLPQAFRRMLPAFVNEAISLTK